VFGITLACVIALVIRARIGRTRTDLTG